MSSIIYNGHEIQDLIINGNQAQLWLNGQKLYPSAEPAPPVDPYNPLGLPPFTIRCKFQSGYTPSGIGDSQTLVDAGENVWDITKNSTNWSGLFMQKWNLQSILGANSTGVTNMYRMCYNNDMISFSIFDTRDCLNMDEMFDASFKVQTGALALYQQASAQATVPSHSNTFNKCGINTTTGLAELQQIPQDWGGLKIESSEFD